MKNEEENIGNFFEKYPVMKFQKGEKVVRPGILASNVLYIKSGFIRLYIVSKEAKDVTICFLNASKLKNVIMGISSRFNKYSVEALTELEVVQVPQEAFIAYIYQKPAVFAGFSKSLFELADTLFEQSAWLKSGDSYTKVASAIYYLHRDFSTVVDNTRQIDLKLTHHMLASLTGLTRETVTLQMNVLQKKGIIQYRNNYVHVHNYLQLKVETDYQDEVVL
ncbi:MAG TPA: Crp/Fnr family transcriptional regulator [Candidatus Saccharimonadales bacterium]|nr:Crp/Fnr family transcriptional regulator [Candidatus Saccharimonadales bacterium]